MPTRCIPRLVGLLIPLVLVGWAAGGQVATVTVHATGLQVVPQVGHEGVVLTVSGPSGVYFRWERPAGEVFVSVMDAAGYPLPDGQYAYEVRLTPVIDSQVRETLRQAREAGDDQAVVADLQRKGHLPREPLVQSGYFQIQGGTIVLPGQQEPRR